jgi:hypothetical protein
MSQRDTVATLLRQDGGLTEYTARRHGVGQVRTRICELRQAGWRIDTSANPLGDTTWVLVQEPGQPPRQAGLGL